MTFVAVSIKTIRTIAIIKELEEEYSVDDIVKLYSEKHQPIERVYIGQRLSKLCTKGKIDRVGNGVYVTNKFGRNL